MKKKVLFAVLALSVALPSFAYITRSDTYSSDFLKLNGYSDTSILMVQHERNKASGIPNEMPKKIVRNKFMRVLYNVYSYVDPACEGNTFLNHNIEIEPSVNDL